MAAAGGGAGGSSRSPSITIHSSWRGIILGAVGAGAIAAAGTYGVASVGFRFFPGLLFVVGWILVLAVLIDYPLASTFTPDEVVRRMVLRRQHVPWTKVDQLTRVRPTVLRIDRRLEHGGLAFTRGRRRYLLVDRVESAGEYDEMVKIVEDSGGTGGAIGASMLPRPGEKVPPTWLYRRARWRPEWATGR